MRFSAGYWYMLIVLSCLLDSSPVRADEKMAVQSLKALGAIAIEDIRREGQPIVDLGLKGAHITDEVMDSVVELKELTSLTINEAAISGAGLKKLAALPKLTNLSLDGCKFTGQDLGEFSSFKSLQSLDLRHTSVFDSGQVVPIRVPTLTKLQISISQTVPQKLDLSALAELHALEELTIVDGHVPIAFTTDFTPISHLKNLTVLKLDHFQETAIRGIDQLTSVREVRLFAVGWISGNSSEVLTDHLISQLKHLPNLRNLDLLGRRINKAGFEALGTLNQLQQLNLMGTPTSDNELKCFHSLKSLTKLQLNGTFVTATGVRELGLAMPSTTIMFGTLTESSASRTAKKELSKLGGMFIDAIRHDTQERSLNAVILRGTAIQDDDLKLLVAISDFVSLDLSDTNISDGGLPHLLQLTRLQALNLNGTKITEKGIEQLAQLTNLNVLHLGGLPLTDAGLKKLYVLENLVRLTIDGSGVSAESIDKLQATRPKLKVTVQ